MAHLGTLKLIDELNIPIDCVVGTSIGGIVGALYAIGYSGWDIEKIAEGIDWDDLLTDRPARAQVPYFLKKDDGRYQFDLQLERFIPQTPSGLSYGQKVTLLFSSLTFPYESIDDFDNLPIPFRCVAADLVTGNQIVIKQGSLAQAMRATMAIPSVFSPVEWEDYLLIDGGVLNNLPVDVARDMGADIIIAVDLGAPLKPREKLNSADVILSQTINLVEIAQKSSRRNDADILIHPNMEGMSVMDFFDQEKLAEIQRRGEEAAREAQPSLQALKARLGLEREAPASAGESPLATIFSLQITGPTVTPFKTIYREIGLKPGDFFDPVKTRIKLAEVRARLDLERLECEVIPISSDNIRLLIHVRERTIPRLGKMVVLGNKHLPEDFIRRLIGYQTGDELETEDINQRIMALYALGYFENIHYDLEPLGDKQVELRLHVRELPRSRLRLGIHYDRYHRVVVSSGVYANNLLIPGLRLESELQLGGRTRILARASYPSRALNLPIYPFLQWGYRSYPAEIFNGSGARLTSFHDRSWTMGMGLGVLFEKWFNAEFEYRLEFMATKPKVATPDSEFYPLWKDRLSLLCARVVMDTRDDILMPSEGFLLDALFEGSYSRLDSQKPYQKLEVKAAMHQTFRDRHTFRLTGYWAESDLNLPIYKTFNMGRPEHFVGMDYDHLRAARLKILRLDYRYRINNFLHAEFISNIALDAEQRLMDEILRPSRLWGAGVGILIETPVGPLKFITSTGSRSLRDPTASNNVFYIILGVRF